MKHLTIVCFLFCVISCDTKIEIRDDPQTDEGRTTRDINTLCDSAMRFKRDVGRFPKQGEGLLALLRNPGSAIGWKGPYLHARGKPDYLMMNDWFGTNYRYVYISDDEVEIISAGKDVQFGTADDISRKIMSPPSQ